MVDLSQHQQLHYIQWVSGITQHQILSDIQPFRLHHLLKHNIGHIGTIRHRNFFTFKITQLFRLASRDTIHRIPQTDTFINLRLTPLLYKIAATLEGMAIKSA